MSRSWGLRNAAAGTCPRPPVQLRLARNLAWVARPYEPLADSPTEDFAPSKLGTFDTARPRPVSCSRFRRQIQTPRGGLDLASGNRGRSRGTLLPWGGFPPFQACVT